MGNKHIDKKKKKTSTHLHKGVLEVTRSGMGFVIAKGLDRDILVRPSDFNTAMHGDIVLVRITDWGKNKKPQGEVLQVLDEADENDRVMKEILLENGFTIVFPQNVKE